MMGDEGKDEEIGTSHRRKMPAESTTQSGESASQSVNEGDRSEELVRAVARPSSRQAARARPTYQENELSDISDSDTETDKPTESTSASRPKRVTALPTFHYNESSKTNREKRLEKMERMKQLPFNDNDVFTLNDNDKEFERKYIVAPCLTTINTKWMEARVKMNKKSKEAMEAGRPEDVDRDYVGYISRTWEHYRTGARKIMTALTQYYGKEIHYNDFLAFGQPEFIRCKNIQAEIQTMPSGNYESWAYEGYKLIIQAQLEESRTRENELKFKTVIKDWETMDQVMLEHKCHSKAEKMRREAHDILNELKQKKPHTQAERRQKVQTETRREDVEQQEGFQVLDPSKVIPKYLADQKVQATEKELVQCGRESIVPDIHQMKEFTNLLLVRLNVKNPNICR